MASPRYSQISLEDTCWYHVVSRCVRRAFLCGIDNNTGQSYEYRRDWVEKRIKYLATIFTVDIAAYAIMNNHYHLVVRVDNERVRDLPTEEVIRRWTCLYKGPVIVQRYMSDLRKEMSAAELRQVDMLADVYRQRLCDLSWFMKNLNQYISCRANAEDQVKGHFWESRYKCQALLDEKAVLAAMAYTDLNPVRAGMAEDIEESEHTSARQRILELKTIEAVISCTRGAKNDELRADPDGTKDPGADVEDNASRSSKALAMDDEAKQAPLLQFDPAGVYRASIPFALSDYLEMLNTVGRVVHPARRGYISDKCPPLLETLNMDLAVFVEHSSHFIERFGNHVGDPALLIELAAKRNVRYLRGIARSRTLFSAEDAAA